MTDTELRQLKSRRSSIKVLQSRLAAWLKEKDTNKHGYAQYADASIDALRERIRNNL